MTFLDSKNYDVCMMICMTYIWELKRQHLMCMNCLTNNDVVIFLNHTWKFTEKLKSSCRSDLINMLEGFKQNLCDYKQNIYTTCIMQVEMLFQIMMQ